MKRIFKEFSKIGFLFLLITMPSLKFKTKCIYDNLDYCIDYRHKMRDFIKSIGSYAKEIKPNFIVIPQNGARITNRKWKINWYFSYGLY